MPAAAAAAALYPPRRSATAAATAALLALVYLLPLRDVPLVSDDPALRLFDLAAVAIIAAGSWFVLGSRRHALATGFVLAFCLFYAQLCLAALRGALHGGDGFLIFRSLVWPLYSVGVFAAGALLARRHEPGFVLRHLVWSLAAASAAAYALFLLAPDLVGTWAGGFNLAGYGGALRRFPGLASEPNYWGSLLLFLLPLAWAALLSSQVRARLRGAGVPPWSAGLLLAAAAATLSTFTHAALLASFLGALLFVGAVRRPWLVLGGVALGAVAAATSVLSSGYGAHVVDKLGRLHDFSSMGERFHAALAAARMWAEAPLLGHGVGTYIVYQAEYATMMLRPVEAAYSVVLATLAEQGVLGFALLAILFAALVGLGDGAIRRALGADPVLRMLFLGLLLYAGYFVITGNFYLYYFWFYCGVFHGLARPAPVAAGSLLRGPGGAVAGVPRAAWSPG